MWSKCNGMGKKGGSVKKVVKTKAYRNILDLKKNPGLSQLFKFYLGLSQ